MLDKVRLRMSWGLARRLRADTQLPRGSFQWTRLGHLHRKDGPLLLIDRLSGPRQSGQAYGAAVCALDPDRAIQRMARARAEADVLLALHPQEPIVRAALRHNSRIVPFAGIEIAGPGCRRYADDPLAALIEADSRPAGALGAGTLHEMRCSSVIVLGCGGLGSAVAQLLAQEGMRRIWLVDADEVEEHDLGRSPVGWGPGEIGLPKCHALAGALARWRTPTRLTPVVSDGRSEPAMWREADAAFIAVDNVPARRILGRLAARHLIPAVSIGAGVFGRAPDLYGWEGALTVPGMACVDCISRLPTGGDFEFGVGRLGSLRSLNTAAAGWAVLQWQLYLAGIQTEPLCVSATAGRQWESRGPDARPACPCQSQELGATLAPQVS